MRPQICPFCSYRAKTTPWEIWQGVERLAKYYKGIGVKNVSVHLIEESRHEFLNEAAHREEGLAAIAEFIKRISVRKK